MELLRRANVYAVILFVFSFLRRLLSFYLHKLGIEWQFKLEIITLFVIALQYFHKLFSTLMFIASPSFCKQVVYVFIFFRNVVATGI